VCRQTLFHNPFLHDGGVVAARSDRDTEDTAVRWAEHGVHCIAHVLSADGRGLVTAQDFERMWPALAQDSHHWQDIRDAIPNAWLSAH
jgi:hypothetical protein